MKKILPLTLTLCGAACLFAVAVYAADASAPAATAPTTAARPGEKFATMVADRLGLTAEQRTKLTDLRQAQRTALDAVAGDQALSPEDRRAKVRGIMESNREQMKAVLTPEQQQKMMQAHARMGPGRAGGPQKMGRAGHGAGPQRFGQHRPDPRQMRHLAMRAHQKMKHHREQRAEALGLTDDQRAKMRLIAFQHREKAIGLQKELRAEMEGVLTPEQKAKAQEMKAGHGRRGPGRHHGGDKKGPPPGH
jgi:Spy/CpxP family protein refolding chaperone